MLGNSAFPDFPHPNGRVETMGGAPSPWGSIVRGVAAGTMMAIGFVGSAAADFGSGLYWNGSSWARQDSTTQPTLYAQFSGQHRWYSDSAGQAGAAYAPTERMRLDASGNLALLTGWMGVGRTPITQLDVYNGGSTGTSADNTNVLVTSVNRSSTLIINAAATGVATFTFASGGAESGRVQYANSTNVMTFNTNAGGVAGAGTKMWLDSAGVLGLGAAGGWGTALLQTSSSSPGFDALQPTQPTTNLSICGIGAYAFDGAANSLGGTINLKAAENWSSTAHGTYIQFRTVTAGTNSLVERMRIDAAGNVGIGLTPINRLHIAGAANAASMTLGVGNGGSSFGVTDPSGVYGIFAGTTAAGDSWLQVGRTNVSAAAYSLILQQSGGGVGIGQAPQIGGRRLEVCSLPAQVGNSAFYTNDYVQGTTGTAFFLQFGAASGNTYADLSCYTSGGSVLGAVYLRGNTGVGAVSTGARLHVSQTSGDALRIDNGSNQNHIIFAQSGADKWIQYLNAASLRFWDTTAGADRAILDTSGNFTVVAGLISDSKGDVRAIPQNSQSAAYGLVISDAGKHILHPSADTTARTFTIPANASVAYPIGTAITFVNQSGAGTLTIAITTDTMRLAGAGTTGSRTLAANGIATALKVTATEWIISGTNLT